jgi:putative ribosome biogenesis GTPase RsgA
LLGTKHLIDWYRNYLKLPIIETSVATGVGINILQESIQGTMDASVGHNRVGKTSILNFFLPASVNLKHRL